MSGSPPHAVEESGPAGATGVVAPVSVCHIASGDLWAGAEVQVAALLRSLSADSAITLRAILLNEGRLADELRRLGLSLLVVPESDFGFLEIARRTADWLSQHSVQVIHTHRYKENLLAALLARRCGVPYLVRTQHGLQEPVRGYRLAKHKLLHGLDRLVGRLTANRVIAVSREMQPHLTARFGRSKVTMIRNGIDVSRVRSEWSVAEAKQRLGISPACAVVGGAGRLQPIKRFDILLAAAGKMLESQPDARFVLAGDGPARSSLHRLAAELGLADRVLFLGHRDDVYDVMRAMDLFLITSDHEGLPMVLLEAMALRVPVVARQVGGLTEVLEEGRGRLVDSADPAHLAHACVELLARPEQRNALAQSAYNGVCQEFSVQRTAQQVAALYRSLVYPREARA